MNISFAKKLNDFLLTYIFVFIVLLIMQNRKNYAKHMDT